MVMHLVLGRDGVAYETGPKTFREIVADVRDGQFNDVYRVLSLTFVNGSGRAADVTIEVACAIFVESREHPISYGSAAFKFIERELSCAHAEECAWEEARERFHDRQRDYHRDMMRLDA
jgi:hypothetical protein